MTSDEIKKIGVIGLGYVGFITAVGFALKGYEVKCVDILKETVDQANNGIVPFFEPNLDDNLKYVLENKKFEASTKYDILIDTNISFLCVGTPSLKSGGIDLQYIKKAATNIGKILKKMDHYHIVIVKSTVVPGTTENIILPLLEKKSGKKCGESFSIAMSPEFLKEGDALNDFLNPDRTVIGANEQKSVDYLKKLFKPFGGEILVVKNPRTAEMIKYANNSFLATKISFINEIANICRSIDGIDVNEVAKGIGLDYRISDKFLRSGCGFGGSCFPKDVKAIIDFARNNNYNPILLNSVLEINEKQAEIMLKLLKEAIGNLDNKKIAILGLSFKPNTSDIREAPSIRIIDLLMQEKNIIINAYDPVAIEEAKKSIKYEINYMNSVDECISGTDAVLIITEWNEFKELTPEFYIKNMKNPVIIDGRKIYDFDLFSNKLKYYTIGEK
ncbi:MAG: UDP-glucose dehydrogenase family protein [Candidatus Helarchaeota archaeon]